MYIYDQKGWPEFTWQDGRIKELLITVRHQQGLLLGGMKSIGFELSDEVVLDILTQDVVKSSEIEGELLDKSTVRSSVARHLGMDVGGLGPVDRHVEGVVEMILDATQKYNEPLTQERLFGWHAALFPTGYSGLSKIKVAGWRTGPMQVVSGKMGNPIIHFEGPGAQKVPHEMGQFLDWCNSQAQIDPVLKAGLAHFWFVTIHPFEDGNGRIARAICDMFLARADKTERRFYSLSDQIQRERNSYYEVLEDAQKGTLDITLWLEWYLECLGRAIERALVTFEKVIDKSRYWQSINHLSLNERQKKLINLLLQGFEGNLTTSKWAKIAKCSDDRAYRDILELVDFGILEKSPERGRSTGYLLHRNAANQPIIKK